MLSDDETESCYCISFHRWAETRSVSHPFLTIYVEFGCIEICVSFTRRRRDADDGKMLDWVDWVLPIVVSPEGSFPRPFISLAASATSSSASGPASPGSVAGSASALTRRTSQAIGVRYVSPATCLLRPSVHRPDGMSVVRAGLQASRREINQYIGSMTAGDARSEVHAVLTFRLCASWFGGTKQLSWDGSAQCGHHSPGGASGGKGVHG